MEELSGDELQVAVRQEGEEVRGEEVGVETSQRAVAHEVGGEERQGVEGREGDVLSKGVQVSCTQAGKGRKARKEGEGRFGVLPMRVCNVTEGISASNCLTTS